MKLDHITTDQVIGRSNVELLYEMIMWDEDSHNNDLNIMAHQVVVNLGNHQLILLLICYSQSSILSGFTDKWNLFDEDKEEIYRQIRLGAISHIITFAIIAFIPFWFQVAIESTLKFGLFLGAILLVGYLYLSIKISFEYFIPNNNRINKIKNTTP